MKKFLVLGLSLMVVVSTLTGCNSEKKDKKESNPKVSSSETKDQNSKESTPESSEKESESTVSENKAVAPTGPVEGLSDKYVDYENRTFAVNGKVYILGVNTLQDMIDDGVPFEEGDLADVNNNVKPNYESQRFEIVLGDYYSAQVSVANYTDENATLSSCVLSQVYLPVNLDKEQDVIQFAFPLTITEEELVAQAGEPTERSEYTSDDGKYVSHKLNYLVNSEKYLGNSGYKFEFGNGSLKYLYITYLP